MKLSIGRGLFLLCTLLVCAAAAPAARGDALSGTLTFSFTDDDRIWDFGGFSDCDTVEDVVDGQAVVVTICIVLDMTPDAKGNYEGDGQLVFTQDIEGTLEGPAKGKLRGKDAAVGTNDRTDKASFTLKAEGDLDIGLFPVPTKVLLSCKGPIAADGIYDTICDVTVKLEGYGSAKAKDVPYIDHANGGDWSCTINNLNLVDESHYSGVAIDSLGYSYIVTGKYDASHDDSSLLLKGLKDGNSNGAKIWLDDLVSDAPSTAAGEAKYKLQGYRGNADVATE